MHTNIFDRFSFLSLLVVVVCLPFFCLPFTNIPLENSKGLLLVVGIVASVIFWAIARFLDGKITVPKSWLLASGFGVVLAFLLSCIFVSNSQISWFGTTFDIGSFWFIFSAFILMLMSSIVFRTPKQAKIVLLGTVLSSVIVLVFQTAHLFMPNILSLGILFGKTGNILGSWNALGIFAGFSSLLSLLIIEFFPVSKAVKISLGVAILLSILLAAAVNFPLVWMLIGISSLIIFVYKVSITSQKGSEEGVKKQFPVISFALVMIALLFFISGDFIGNILPSKLQISNTEVGPSFQSTMIITKGALAKNPVFGVGPNRFQESWSMYKPASINGTQFWDTSFSSGSGLLPTLVATTGGLGILAWVVFLVLFLIAGAKSIFSGIKSGANLEMMSFFVLSLYLFISSFFYSTGVVVFLLALAFTGIFIGLIASTKGKEISMSFLNDHRKSFFSILSLVVLVIFSATVVFKYVERFASVFYFEKSLSASTVADALTYVGKALRLNSNDLYLRTYAQIYLVKLNSILNKGGTLSDADKKDLQASFDQAVNSTQLAIGYDASNYFNFRLLGSIYQTAGLLGVDGAYSKAVEAYKTALALNPKNPGIDLVIASALFSDGNTKEAKTYSNAALSLKPDYVDALVSLSQIAKSEGNNGSALSYAEQALSLVPTDASLMKYVDSLKNPASVPASTTTNTKKP